MRFTSLASGSSGNCAYVGTDNTHILVDVGVSCKKITQGLQELDLQLKDLAGIFITHEHSDHIQGLRVISKKNNIPIYATEKTLEKIREYDKKHEIDEACYVEVIEDEAIQIHDMKIEAFRNTHDAAQPVGYRIENEKSAVAVATDLGNFSEYTLAHLRGLDAILIEANHDVRMLEVGSYPYYLKRRILSDFGHLSNERCGRLLCEILHDDIKHILLGHISKENNYEALAYETVRTEITAGLCPYQADDFNIHVANRDTISDIMHL